MAESSANGTYHFKILVPSVAAGAIIGKGGETIAQLQKEAGARVKMSKATDFYPGTTERVCLITGSIEGIIRIHEFIMEKVKEKPDPNAKMAIDFDHKQPAEREKQICSNLCTKCFFIVCSFEVNFFGITIFKEWCPLEVYAAVS